MPQIQYPFIDIAVHPAVRTRFAAGDAIVLFSAEMDRVLWANGEGARLFGHADIYDFLDNGPDRSSVAFRQLAATARQLGEVGDHKRMTIRISSGFSSRAVAADVALIDLRKGERAVIFCSPIAENDTEQACVRALLKGFDDPDTHMAVIDGDGKVLASSPGYAGLGIRPESTAHLLALLKRSPDGLVKRPIATAAGYLPAAIGAISIEPSRNILFCVETVLGRMDAPDGSYAVEEKVETAGVAETAAAASDAEIAATVTETARPEPTEREADLAEAVADEQPVVAETTTETVEPTELAADEAETASLTDEIPEEVLEHTIPEVAHVAEPAVETEAEENRAHDAVIAEAEDLAPEVTALEDDVTGEDEAAFEAADEPEDEAPEEDIADLAVLDGATTDEVERAGEADETAATGVDELSEAEAVAAAAGEDIEAASDAQDGEAVDADIVAGAAATETDAVHDAELEQPESVSAAAEPESEPADEAGEQEVVQTTDDEQAPAEAEAATTEAASDTTTGEPVAETVPGAGDGSFRFEPSSRPVRFVWKLDANGRFADVSEEFARTVGPHAGDINGMAFRDLAHLFNLDPNDEIAALLERRDTWSGKTIRWPVEGTDLVVPVDLAALPTYSRNREFDGFRGFGIIRTADAEKDPNALGMTLRGAENANDADIAAEEGEAPEEPASLTHEDIPLTIDDQFNRSDDDEPASAGEFRGEMPAIAPGPTSLASVSEKIVKLEERRSRTREGLTPSEQNALKEIARQLEPFGRRPNELLTREELQATEDEARAEAERQRAAQAEADRASEDVGEIRAPAEETDNSDDAVASKAHDDAADFDEEIVGDDYDDDALGFDEEDQPADAADGRGLTAAAADQVPVALLIHAGDRLIHLNTEFKRFTGFSSIEALEAAGGLDALITRREGSGGGVCMVRSDGTEVPVNARLQSVLYEGAKVLMLSMTAIPQRPPVEDSEAARKLAALKVEVDELRSILETATDGVVVLDTDGRIRSMNRSASALFNYEDSEIRGKPFAMLFAHESQKAVQDYLNGLAGHGVASVLNDGREVIGREASGGFIPLFMTIGRMPGSNSYCAVIRDITQWKRSEEELKAAKRAAETANQHKSDFLARVSHEIRTPLNAIIGFSDMIASEHFGPAGHPRYVEYANDIGRSGRHVLEIVNDLLDISKIEAGEMDLEFSAVNINECVSEAVSLVQPQANAQRVIIRTSLSQSVPDVVADLRSIKQIAINILANAIRFTPSGGQIVVSTAYEPNGAVTLRIRDTGVGMSKAELEQALKPFGQVSTGARKRGDGTGLGLPLTRAMTEANRASFSIQSAPNEGTLVEISFPPQRVLAD